MEKPTIKQRLDGFSKFIWNPESKEFCGRGGRSWAEIGLFYLVYYICLAAFFAVTILVFYETIDSDVPALTGDSSLLKANPGMGFKPMPDIDSTLIRTTDKNKDYVKNLNKALEKYKEEIFGTTDCSDVHDVRQKEKLACKFNYTALTEECNPGNSYGMADGRPCVLLKLNRIYGWVPEVWTAKEAKETTALPDSIKEKYTPDRIWVQCSGENKADEANIGKNNITYYPTQGFPLAFYPFLKQENYRSPLVFVKFNSPTRSLGLMIECKAFAKNIEVDRSEVQGSVHFELLVDNKE